MTVVRWDSLIGGPMHGDRRSDLPESWRVIIVPPSRFVFDGRAAPAEAVELQVYVRRHAGFGCSDVRLQFFAHDSLTAAEAARLAWELLVERATQSQQEVPDEARPVV